RIDNDRARRFARRIIYNVTMQARWNLGGCLILITGFAHGRREDEVCTAERRSEAEWLSERRVRVEQYGRRQGCGREAGNGQCSGHRELPASFGLLFAACYLQEA